MVLNIATLASIYKALSDETRLKILYLLKMRPLCVCEIMGALDITQTKTSRHLIYLKNAGLLEAKKEDRWMLYRIREYLPEGLGMLIDETITLVGKTRGVAGLEKRLDAILNNESIYRQTFGIDGKRALDSSKISKSHTAI